MTFDHQCSLAVKYLMAPPLHDELRQDDGHHAISSVGVVLLDVVDEGPSDIAVRRILYLEWMRDAGIEPLVAKSLGGLGVKSKADRAYVRGLQSLGVLDRLKRGVVYRRNQDAHVVARRLLRVVHLGIDVLLQERNIEYLNTRLGEHRGFQPV